MAEVSDDACLWAQFEAICDCGGRLAGSPSQVEAVALLKRLGQCAMDVPARVEAVNYVGWKACPGTLTTTDGATHAVHPLLGSVSTPAGGLDAEVVSLWRGTPEEFEAHWEEIRGRVVLVRHELMFAPGTIHRRQKYRAAVAAGAVGFLIAGPVPGSLVSGSSDRDLAPAIPAAGIAPETAQRLLPTATGLARIRLHITTQAAAAVAENLHFDTPGNMAETVVLSAHIDGHDLGESAIDNATGLAVALAVARRLRLEASRWRRRLRLSLFNVEEWALTGSAEHVAALTEGQRAGIALNVNLDSVAGGGHLTALTSGFAGLEPFLLRCADDAGVELGLFRPLLRNSDHANFALAGIPAFRLVAGFADERAATRLALTAFDRRAEVDRAELVKAAALTQSIVRAALMAPATEVSRWRVVPG